MAERVGARPAWIYVVMVVGAALVAVLLFLWFSGADDQNSAEPASPTTTSAFPSPSASVKSLEPAAPFTQADADRIASALNSGDDATIAAVLVLEFREAFTATGGEVLPSGSTASLLTEQFVAVEPALASVPVMVTGEKTGHFLLLLSYAEGQWMVLGTEEVQ